MKRTISITQGNTTSTLNIAFKEGKQVVARFTFWNYVGYGDALTRTIYEFVTLGQLPKEQHGFQKVK